MVFFKCLITFAIRSHSSLAFIFLGISRFFTLSLRYSYVFANLNCMVRFTFSDLDCRYPFSANLVQKIKIVCLSWHSLPRQIQTYWIRRWCKVVLFWTGNTHFRQIWSKNQNFLFKMKFDAKNNSNVLNLMAMFVFTVLGQKPFFLQICSKNQNCLFKIKLGVYTNLNVLNPMVMFICPVLDWKYNLFWQIWSRKSKLSV